MLQYIYNKRRKGDKQNMRNINLDYGTILELELYMEKEIKEIKQQYNDYLWKYHETCLYNQEKSETGRSLSTDYGMTKEKYEEYTKLLQIMQYKTFLRLKRLIETCKEQNDGEDYICHTNGLLHELIRFNPSYDDVTEELERLMNGGIV